MCCRSDSNAQTRHANSNASGLLVRRNRWWVLSRCGRGLHLGLVLGCGLSHLGQLGGVGVDVLGDGDAALDVGGQVGAVGLVAQVLQLQQGRDAGAQVGDCGAVGGICLVVGQVLLAGRPDPAVPPGTLSADRRCQSKAKSVHGTQTAWVSASQCRDPTCKTRDLRRLAGNT